MKILLGYDHKQYTNKDGRQVSGYEIYFAQLINNETGKGYSPSLRYNVKAKKFQNWFVSDENFNKIKDLGKLVGKEVQVYTDPDFGNIVSIISA